MYRGIVVASSAVLTPQFCDHHSKRRKNGTACPRYIAVLYSYQLWCLVGLCQLQVFAERASATANKPWAPQISCDMSMEVQLGQPPKKADFQNSMLFQNEVKKL